jgi:tetratricopeptide (TPR) repeat protein
MLAASYSCLHEYQNAYDVLNKVLALGKGRVLDEIYVLHAQLCIKLHSNTVSLWPQAVNDYDYLIGEHPEDMNFVLQRGMVNCMLQEFDTAIADFDYILYYQPSLSTVLCLRLVHCLYYCAAASGCRVHRFNWFITFSFYHVERAAMLRSECGPRHDLITTLCCIMSQTVPRLCLASRT